MRHIFSVCAVTLSFAALLGCAGEEPTHAVTDQNEPDGHGHSVLFVADLSGDNVTSPIDTMASGTGIFIARSDGNSAVISYRLTYDGLSSNAPASLTLRNFGAGGDGEIIHSICGADGPECPPKSGSTLTGRWRPDPSMFRELNTGRIYLAVDNQDNQNEIRGQLITSEFMIHPEAYVAAIEQQNDTIITGTAAVFRVPFPDGRESIKYSATVTGIQNTVRAATLIQGDEGFDLEADPSQAREVEKLDVEASRQSDTGGTVSGNIVRDRVASEQLKGDRLIASMVDDMRSQSLAIILSTEDGDIIANLEPVATASLEN